MSRPPERAGKAPITPAWPLETRYRALFGRRAGAEDRAHGSGSVALHRFNHSDKIRSRMVLKMQITSSIGLIFDRFRPCFLPDRLLEGLAASGPHASSRKFPDDVCGRFGTARPYPGRFVSAAGGPRRLATRKQAFRTRWGRRRTRERPSPLFDQIAWIGQRRRRRSERVTGPYITNKLSPHAPPRTVGLRGGRRGAPSLPWRGIDARRGVAPGPRNSYHGSRVPRAAPEARAAFGRQPARRRSVAVAPQRGHLDAAQGASSPRLGGLQDRSSIAPPRARRGRAKLRSPTRTS